jgi:hypothetical protein
LTGELTCPFSNHNPLISSRKLGALRASIADMLAWFSAYLSIREDRVDMCIEYDIVDTTTGVHEAIPVFLDIKECIRDGNGGITIGFSNVTPSIVIELLDFTYIISPIGRLI